MILRTLQQHVNSRLDQVVNFTHGERAAEVIRTGEFHSQIRRLTLLAVLSTPGLPKFLYDQRIIRPYAQVGREVIGSGAHSITLADGADMVQKILFETRGKSEVDQRAIITELEADQDISLRYLERFTPPQSFRIESDPLNPALPIVTARQRRIEGISATPIFHGEIESNNTSDDFITGSREMLDGEYALPDLAGNANVILNNDGLHMVDTLCLRESRFDDSKAFNTTLNILTPHFDRLSRDQTI